MLGITRQSDIRGSDTQIKMFNKSLLKLSEIDIWTRIRASVTQNKLFNKRLSKISWSVHMPVSMSITIYLY